MKMLFFFFFSLLLGVSGFQTNASLKITGRITDEKGNALAGASIIHKETQKVATSGRDGRYQIEVPDGRGTLQFRSVGFQHLDEPIKGRTQIDVVLKPSHLALEEVVVTGYAPQRKLNITGSVATRTPYSKPVYPNVPQLARGALGQDEEGCRREFISLVKDAADLQ